MIKTKWKVVVDFGEIEKALLESDPNEDAITSTINYYSKNIMIAFSDGIKYGIEVAGTEAFLNS